MVSTAPMAAPPAQWAGGQGAAIRLLPPSTSRRAPSARKTTRQLGPPKEANPIAMVRWRFFYCSRILCLLCVVCQKLPSPSPCTHFCLPPMRCDAVKICAAGQGGSAGCPPCPQGTWAAAGNMTKPVNPCAPCDTGQTTPADGGECSCELAAQSLCMPCSFRAGFAIHERLSSCGLPRTTTHRLSSSHAVCT